MELVFGLFVAALGRWAWPGCVESARCRRFRGCRDCTLIVPCDVALQQLEMQLPLVEAKARWRMLNNLRRNPVL